MQISLEEKPRAALRNPDCAAWLNLNEIYTKMGGPNGNLQSSMIALERACSVWGAPGMYPIPRLGFSRRS